MRADSDRLTDEAAPGSCSLSMQPRPARPLDSGVNPTDQRLEVIRRLEGLGAPDLIRKRLVRQDSRRADRGRAGTCPRIGEHSPLAHPLPLQVR
jgi:hypothetical protein